MNKKDFLKKVEKLGCTRVPRNEKELLGKNAVYLLEEKTGDLYGIYKNKENKYVLFYKASERAISKTIGEYDIEDEAFEKLYDYIKK